MKLILFKIEDKIEEKYTINDHNNFNHIIKNQDNDIVDHISNYNSETQKDSEL